MSTPHERAAQWLASNDTGMSSEALCGHMLGKADKRWATAYPSDPDDLGRCLRLLALIPEWKPRVPEMAVHGRYWAALVPRWDELEALMAAETEGKGTDGKTYALMKSILNPIEDADPNVVRFAPGVTMRFS